MKYGRERKVRSTTVVRIVHDPMLAPTVDDADQRLRRVIAALV